MKKLLLVAAFVAVCSFFNNAVPAQDAEDGANANAVAQTRDDTPEYKKFSDEMKAYKESLKKLRSLKEAYQTASAEEKDKIVAEFEPIMDSAMKQRKALVASALTAYQSIEGANDELRAFLCSMLQWLTVNCENYELAYDVAKGLFPYPIPESADPLYAYAAYAAFCTMNLEDAKTWRDIAIEKKVLAKADPKDEMHMAQFLRSVLPEYEDAWKEEQEARKADEAKELPRVVLHTSKGDIVIELFKDEAPNAVGNFLTLIDKGFYTDVPFHRVLPFFMAQGGDPTGTGTGGPGYCIPCECYKPNARKHFRGSLSMAHAGRDTGGSQFFLTFVPTSFLDGRHTVFGRVIEGLDVMSDLQRIDPEKESEAAPDKILSAEILRGEPFEFQKLQER